MDIGVVAAVSATAVAFGLLVARGRGIGGRRPSRSAVVVTGLLALDLWLWAFALDGSSGRHHWLLVPLVLANALVAFGAIYSLTGFGLHSDDPVYTRTTTMYKGYRGALRDRGD